MEHKVPIQSLIDHIKTAVDVDDWAKEMAEMLLKKQACEQRVRVLSIEEVQPNDLVYIEWPQSNEICPAFLVEDDWFEERTWRTTGFGATHYFLHDEYGRDWRCWTARPTTEQREAVKWE